MISKPTEDEQTEQMEDTKLQLTFHGCCLAVFELAGTYCDGHRSYQ